MRSQTIVLLCSTLLAVAPAAAQQRMYKCVDARGKVYYTQVPPPECLGRDTQELDKSGTPMRKSQYVMAQFLSRLIFLVVEVTVLVAFGWLVFGVRVNGSILVLALLCIVGGYAFSGLGLLTASRARTLEGVSGLMNLIMMPMWLCSGVFFSYERFPDAAKPFIRALPLTMLNDALRAVMNDAAPLTKVMPQLAFLAVWGIVTFAVGLKIFRWQ